MKGMKARLVKKLTDKEIEVALACGAENMKDFICIHNSWLPAVGQESDWRGYADEEYIRQCFTEGTRSFWLFETVEE